MKRPTRELVDAFLAWFRDDPHSTQEDNYAGTVTQEHLSQMGREEFIEFFYQFACDGGYVQSGGHRTASRFRATIEARYDEFRAFVLEPFAEPFDETQWLERIHEFSHFGAGLATIFLNRITRSVSPSSTTRRLRQLSCSVCRFRRFWCAATWRFATPGGSSSNGIPISTTCIAPML